MELLPHLVKLVPAANRFLQDRNSGDEATRQAMDAMAARVRSDLEQVTAAHSGIYRQLNEQAGRLEQVAADVAATRVAIESAEGRVARMQRRTNVLSRMLVAALVMIFALMVMVFALLFRH
jgi:hypothetical protein